MNKGKNLFKVYVVGLLDAVEQQLSEYMNDKKPASLHHLRVEIKKMKALFFFIKKVDHEKHEATQLRPLFDKAGEIREIQINIHLLGLFKHPPTDLMTLFLKREKRLTREFVSSCPSFINLVKVFRKNISLPTGLPDIKTLQNYFKKEKEKAAQLLETSERENIHRYRTKIKRIMYVYHILPKKIQKQMNLNVTRINKQQQTIGEWHDTYAAIQFLSQPHLPVTTSAYIVKLKAKEKKQWKGLF